MINVRTAASIVFINFNTVRPGAAPPTWRATPARHWRRIVGARVDELLESSDFGT
jgi:hypothetical protein